MNKPRKPRADFPLTPHASGKWVKKIRGRAYYFGRWADPEGAEREYDRVKHDLRAGRAPLMSNPGELTIRDLFNAFLERRQERVDAGTLAPLTYQNYRTALAAFAKHVGPTRLVNDIRPGDFANVRAVMGKGVGPHALNRAITAVKAAFRFGLMNGLMDRIAPFGDGFNKDPISVKRRLMREKSYRIGKKLFTPAECRLIVKMAAAPFNAMALLGLNCGFLAADVATLPRAAVNLDEAWLQYPRTKTEVMRVAPLWPETVAALRQAIKVRPKPRNAADDGLIFLTQHGNRWVNVTIHRGDEGIEKVTRTDSINHAFTDLLTSIKVKRKTIRRKGINFSALRATFRTVSDEVGEPNAVMLIMGHAFRGMDEWYVRDVARERLKKVTDHVRRKLLNAK